MNILQIQHHCTVKKPDFYYNRPNGLEEYVLVLTHSKAYYHADGVRYLLQQNQLFIYDKLQPQLFYSNGEDYCHDWFHFDMDDAERKFFDSLDIPFGCPLTVSNPFVLSELIKMLATEHRFEANHRDEIIDLYMRCFFLKLSDMIHTPINFKANHPLYQCLCLLRNEIYSFPYKDWTLDKLIKRVHTSKSWFQHSYREIFGCSYQTDLIQSRVEYAQNLLYHTNYTIKHISELCGYNSDVHFMRQFKSKTGFTPSAYRKKFKLHTRLEA